MSMIDNDEPLSRECANCPVIAFEPKACAICGPHTGKLCGDCRATCDECGETACLDHISANRGKQLCDACERQRAIESGEALADWKWGRDF